MRIRPSFVAVALALATTAAVAPAGATSECAPEPIVVDYFYPAGESSTTDASGVPVDATFVVGFSKATCDEPGPGADAVHFQLVDAENVGVPAVVERLPADDVLSRMTLHGFTITPEAPLIPGATYAIVAEGDDAELSPRSARFVVLDATTQHAEPPTLEVAPFDAGDGWVDVEVGYERPPQAHGIVLLRLTTAEGRPVGPAVLPRVPGEVAIQSFEGLPDGAERACIQPLLRAPDAALIEGTPACFSLDGGGGCSVGDGRGAPACGILIAALAALGLLRRRTATAA